ncbi:MAG TPA: NAD(P)-dependent oxidoreductase, partial [Desulfobacteraceae bacterium]|nr:NAD(P)-dependent oxidoreductase [Desulfobacteraceae bacterium]
MKIVITGGRGQLGGDCRRVLAPGHTVHAFGSGDLDITDEQQVENIVRRLQPDIVINCAAYTAVDACEDDRERCRLVNGTGPGLLAAATADTGCKLIHVSTDYVFDGKKPLPAAYREDDPVAPLSAY